MAMEIQVAEPLNEEEIRSMADDDIIDPYVEECLRAAQSGMERMSADADWFPFVAHLEWVEAREEYAVLGLLPSLLSSLPSAASPPQPPTAGKAANPGRRFAAGVRILPPRTRPFSSGDRAGGHQRLGLL